MLLQTISNNSYMHTDIINEEERFIFKRNFTKAQLLFISPLQDVDWNCVLNESGRGKAYLVFVNMYNSLYSQAFPKTKVKVKYSHRKHRLTEVTKYATLEK